MIMRFERGICNMLMYMVVEIDAFNAYTEFYCFYDAACAAANAAVECGHIAQIYHLVDGKYEFLQEM